jgi:hypothetical protein
MYSLLTAVEIEMLTYPKIETLFERDDTTHKLKEPLVLRAPVYGTIKTWSATEKVDGTNIRVCITPDNKVSMNGRTDNAQLPADLVKWVYEKFTPEKMQAIRIDPTVTLTLFGEGYGAGIQKGGSYRADKAVILFDAAVEVDGKVWWLDEPTVRGFGETLEVECVPHLGNLTLDEIVVKVRVGFVSPCATISAVPSEGIVARPLEPLYDRRGNRLILKLKTKDFA